MMIDQLVNLFPEFNVESQEGKFIVKGTIQGFPVNYLFYDLKNDTMVDMRFINQFVNKLRNSNISKCYIIQNQRLPKKVMAHAARNGIFFTNTQTFLAKAFHIEPQIPIKYFKPSLKTAEVTLDIFYNNKMLLSPSEKAINQLKIDKMISLDKGSTTIALADYIVDCFSEKKPDITGFEKLDLREEHTYSKWNDDWLLSNILVDFKWSKPAYLIYLGSKELAMLKTKGKFKADQEISIPTSQLPPPDQWIMVGNPYGWPVKTYITAKGNFELPDDMRTWIPQHLTFNNE